MAPSPRIYQQSASESTTERQEMFLHKPIVIPRISLRIFTTSDRTRGRERPSCLYFTEKEYVTDDELLPIVVDVVISR
jgi:hypothetical protein